MLACRAGRPGPAATGASRRAAVSSDLIAGRARAAGGAAGGHRRRIAETVEATAARTRGRPADTGTVQTARAIRALSLTAAGAGSAGGASVCPARITPDAQRSAASTGLERREIAAGTRAAASRAGGAAAAAAAALGARLAGRARVASVSARSTRAGGVAVEAHPPRTATLGAGRPVTETGTAQAALARSTSRTAPTPALAG